MRLSGVLAAKRVFKRRFEGGWASVLVFHRVTDELPEDGVTVSSERFRSILSMLQRRYTPISAGDLVSRLETGHPFSDREVLITFDDGYRDNIEIAAPILESFGFPACFFLTAGYVGTGRTFWWDAEKGHESKLMSWAEAKQLVDRGFEVGAHTWSHP